MPSSLASASVLLPLSDGTPPRSRISTKAVLIGSFVWIALVSGTAYVMEQARRSEARSVEMLTALAGQVTTAPDQTPVYYTNPFDKAEVFEFPHGTSAAQAHTEVAELLLQRARGRLGQAQHPTRMASAGPIKIVQ